MYSLYTLVEGKGGKRKKQSLILNSYNIYNNNIKKGKTKERKKHNSQRYLLIKQTLYNKYSGRSSLLVEVNLKEAVVHVTDSD